MGIIRLAKEWTSEISSVVSLGLKLWLIRSATISTYINYILKKGQYFQTLLFIYESRFFSLADVKLSLFESDIAFRWYHAFQLRGSALIEPSFFSAVSVSKTCWQVNRRITYCHQHRHPISGVYIASMCLQIYCKFWAWKINDTSIKRPEWQQILFDVWT